MNVLKWLEARLRGRTLPEVNALELQALDWLVSHGPFQVVVTTQDGAFRLFTGLRGDMRIKSGVFAGLVKKGLVDWQGHVTDLGWEVI